MKLYTYWRSTSSFRVRIALALKGIEAEQVFVHLVRDGGEQNAAAYRAVNPQGRVPSLALDNGIVLTQSSAIIEYLDETYSEPRLLPVDEVERAKVRAVAGIIGCDIHPLHNVSPLNYLRHVLGHSEDEVGRWIARWIEDGFSAVEAQIGGDGFCFGALPGLADVYLIPQVYAARRFGVPLDAFPKILRVEAIASQHGAFQQAHPANQGDAQ